MLKRFFGLRLFAASLALLVASGCNAGRSTNSSVLPTLPQSGSPISRLPQDWHVGNGIYVALHTQAGPYPWQILIFPPFAAGVNVPPARIIAGPDTKLPLSFSSELSITSLAVDPEGYLYVMLSNLVAGGEQARVLVYAPFAFGNAAPVFDISGHFGTHARFVDIDDLGRIYVSNGKSVFVFPHGANGLQPPIQVITPHKLPSDQGAISPQEIAAGPLHLFTITLRSPNPVELLNNIEVYPFTANGFSFPLCSMRSPANGLGGIPATAVLGLAATPFVNASGKETIWVATDFELLEYEACVIKPVAKITGVHVQDPQGVALDGSGNVYELALSFPHLFSIRIFKVGNQNGNAIPDFVLYDTNLKDWWAAITIGPYTSRAP